MPLSISPKTKRVLEVLGTSRHSFVPVARDNITKVTKPVAVQGILLAAGSTLIGAAVALLVQADLGLPPYDVLASGLQRHLPLSLGQAGWAVAAVLFVLAALLRRPPSAWGAAYIIANGIAVDAMADLINPPESSLARVAFLLVAIVVMASGINLVLYSGTTGGPFELLMRAGEDRGLSPTHVRYVLDVAVLVLGLIIGGAAGIGTVIYAALMGAMLQTARQIFNDYHEGRLLRLALITIPEVTVPERVTSDCS